MCAGQKQTNIDFSKPGGGYVCSQKPCFPFRNKKISGIDKHLESYNITDLQIIEMKHLSDYDTKYIFQYVCPMKLNESWRLSILCLAIGLGRATDRVQR